MSLFVVIKGGIESNEMVNEGIDRLLHDWQLKFNMIGWSGGFIQVTDCISFENVSPHFTIGDL